MNKDQEIDLSTTAASNTDFGGVGVGEGMPPSDVNNAMRYLAKMRADAVTRHVAKSAGSYTAVKADHNQFWRCTGAVTINLTAAATLTSGWCLWVRANGGAVTIDPSGAEQIDGSATSKLLADGMTALILCTGTAFFTVMGGSATPGDVAGPSSSTDNAIARFDGTTGKLLQNSGASIDDSGNLTAVAGTLTGAFTSRGIDDNATGTRLRIENDGIALGAANSAYTVGHVDNDRQLTLAGFVNPGVSSDGGQIVLYGPSHATRPGDVEILGSASATSIAIDDSASRIDLSAATAINAGGLGGRIAMAGRVLEDADVIDEATPTILVGAEVA